MIETDCFTKELLDEAKDHLKNMQIPMGMIFPRQWWEFESKQHLPVFGFTKEELDQAEKTEGGFIGNRAGWPCYLRMKF